MDSQSNLFEITPQTMRWGAGGKGIWKRGQKPASRTPGPERGHILAWRVVRIQAARCVIRLHLDFPAGDVSKTPSGGEAAS
jgi:hypothetical protein